VRIRKAFLVLAVLAAGCTSSADVASDESADPTSVAATTTTTVAPSTTGTPDPPTSTTPARVVAEIRMVTLNVLHGLALPDSCGPDTDNCQVTDRLDLLWSEIEDQAGCPDVVALQEIGPRQIELIPKRLGELCDGEHELVFNMENGFDQEMILTTLPIVDEGLIDISGPVWTSQWARLETSVGPVDIYTTHFASSAFNPDCVAGEGIESCPPICPVGIEMGSCHSLETLAWLDPIADDAAAQFIVGDLNKVIDDPRIQILTDAGFEDVWLEAGNSECVRETGEWCTSGLDGDSELDGLDDPAATFNNRIDFVLYRAAKHCAVSLDDFEDRDGDGTSTGLFAVGPIDPPRNDLVWFSDHQGVQADVALSCDLTSAS
jgi:hypothetical protein